MINDKYKGLLEQFEMEITLLKALRHPNIIHLEDVFHSSTRIHMVMEYMRGGELFDYIVKRGYLNELEASGLVLKISSAIAYMHENNIVHRDLKPGRPVWRACFAVYLTPHLTSPHKTLAVVVVVVWCLNSFWNRMTSAVLYEMMISISHVLSITHRRKFAFDRGICKRRGEDH